MRDDYGQQVNSRSALLLNCRIFPLPSTTQSCQTVTKTGECDVRWEDECTDLPHEVNTHLVNRIKPSCHKVQTGVTTKEVLKTVCKPGQQLAACPPPSLTSCTEESSVSQCWSADTYDSDCEGTLCCFNGCADVCLPPIERSCREVTLNGT